MTSSLVPVLAEKTEKYCQIKAEYSDRRGEIENLDLMVLDEHIYVDAEQLGNRLGYQVYCDENKVVIYNTEVSNIPISMTTFYFESTRVGHMLFSKWVDTYKAPFKSIKNTSGSWIPLEFAVIMLNSGVSLADDTLIINMPELSIIDYYTLIGQNIEKYSFDYNKDFGYTNSEENILGSLAGLITVSDGLLKMDGASWAQIFKILPDNEAYERKYGKKIALLFCTTSQEELNAVIGELSDVQNLFTSDGALGKALNEYGKELDTNLGNLESTLEQLKLSGGSTFQMNKVYRELENAFDKQNWYESTGGNINAVQKQFSETFGDEVKFLSTVSKVASVVKYAKEFKEQDEFSKEALTKVLEENNNSNGFSDASKDSMRDYVISLDLTAEGYSFLRWLDENASGWIADLEPLSAAVAADVSIALAAWNISSSVIPVLSDGLSGADDFLLCLYAQAAASDALNSYLSCRNEVFDSGKITPESLYQITQYAYAYLKFCYITRDAGIGSLKSKSENFREKINDLILYQQSINSEIAQILTKLKKANNNNDGYVYGFLPQDNNQYLKTYSDDWLLKVIDSSADIGDVEGFENENGEMEEPTSGEKNGRLMDSGTIIGLLDWNYYNTGKLIVQGKGILKFIRIETEISRTTLWKIKNWNR